MNDLSLIPDVGRERMMKCGYLLVLLLLSLCQTYGAGEGEPLITIFINCQIENYSTR